MFSVVVGVVVLLGWDWFFDFLLCLWFDFSAEGFLWVFFGAVCPVLMSSYFSLSCFVFFCCWLVCLVALGVFFVVWVLVLSFVFGVWCAILHLNRKRCQERINQFL